MISYHYKAMIILVYKERYLRIMETVLYKTVVINFINNYEKNNEIIK